MIRSMRKLSTGFTNSSTRSISNFEREIENRLGFFDAMPYQDTSKVNQPFEDKHDLKVNRLNAGKAEDQKPLDDLDRDVQKSEAKIKSIKESFPMSKLDSSKKIKFGEYLMDLRYDKTNNGFWVSYVIFDKSGSQKESGNSTVKAASIDQAAKIIFDKSKKNLSLGKHCAGPEAFDKAVEKKLTKLASIPKNWPKEGQKVPFLIKGQKCTVSHYEGDKLILKTPQGSPYPNVIIDTKSKEFQEIIK